MAQEVKSYQVLPKPFDREKARRFHVFGLEDRLVDCQTVAIPFDEFLTILGITDRKHPDDPKWTVSCIRSAWDEDMGGVVAVVDYELTGAVSS